MEETAEKSIPVPQSGIVQNLDVNDSGGPQVKITRGPLSAEPGKEEIIAPEVKKHEPWTITLQAFPEDVKKAIMDHCEKKNEDLGVYMTRQVLAMVHIYQQMYGTGKCPICTGRKVNEAATKQQALTLKQRIEKERAFKNARKRIRSRRRTRKLAKRRNRSR